MAKVIISCAVTGAVHTPTMSPALPVTPDQIAHQAIEAAEAGAAILHLHARDPATGKPTPDPEVFMQFLPRIKQSTDAVVNITTGGGMGMSIEERLAAPLRSSPELCSLNMGSMNFGMFPLVDRYKQFKHDWEAPFLESSRDGIFKNTFRDIETILQRLGQDHGTRFELSATIRRTYTLSRTSSIGSWSRRPCLCSQCSAFWAASGPIPKTFSTPSGSPISCSVRITTGQ